MKRILLPVLLPVLLCSSRCLYAQHGATGQPVAPNAGEALALTATGSGSGQMLPAAPVPSLQTIARGAVSEQGTQAGAVPSSPGGQIPSSPGGQIPSFPGGQVTAAGTVPGPADGVPITREEAERLALKNNPRITASRLLALAAGQVTRETRSGELPQLGAALTAQEAEEASRIGAGQLQSSRLFTKAAVGGNVTQLLTDFGHTRELVANSSLLAKAQDRMAVATGQDVLLETDQAFYRLLDAQSLLEVAKATVGARGSVQNLTQALTKSALRSELDLNIASADVSQAQLLQLDAENGVETAAAALAALLAAPPETAYRAVEDTQTLAPPPLDAAAATREANAQRPDLQALRFNVEADQKLARAQELQYLPTISAIAVGGLTPVRPGAYFVSNTYGAVGVNLSIPLFTGFRIDAQVKEAKLRQGAQEKRAADLSNNIARDVRVATLAAQTAFRRIGVAENFSRETAQALGLAQTRYKLGLSSIVELSQAQLQSTQASVSAVNARFDYLLALRTLDYTQGKLVP